MFSNETEIVLALQNGDEKAMETLFRTYYQRLCNYANTILNDLDESEEVVQQMFVQLWEKREKMESRKAEMDKWLEENDIDKSVVENLFGGQHGNGRGGMSIGF